MRVREWDDIVADVVESDADAAGWRAVGGDRASGVGEDMYVGHPGVGLFQLKTYAKNPFEVKGVGAKVARSVDDDLASFFPEPDADARFAVQQPPEDEDDAETKANRLEALLSAHADAPTDTDPGELFDDVMDVLDSPAFGPMEYDQYDRPGELDELGATFEDAEAALETEFEDVVSDDGVGRGFQ
jgi:hypothetical protein